MIFAGRRLRVEFFFSVMDRRVRPSTVRKTRCFPRYTPKIRKNTQNRRG